MKLKKKTKIQEAAGLGMHDKRRIRRYFRLYIERMNPTKEYRAKVFSFIRNKR